MISDKSLITEQEFHEITHRNQVVTNRHFIDLTLRRISYGDIKIANCDISNLVFAKTSINQITLTNCRIEKITFLEEPAPMTIIINDCLELCEEININGSKIMALAISNCKTINKIQINDTHREPYAGRLTFKDSIITNLEIRNNTFDAIEIVNCMFDSVKTFNTNLTRFATNTEPYHNSTDDDSFCSIANLTLSGNTITDIILTNTTFLIISFNFPNIRSISVLESIFKDVFQIKAQADIGFFSIQNSQIPDIPSGLVEFKNCTNENDKIALHNLTLNGASLGSLRLNKIRELTNINISNSSINKELDINSVKFINLSFNYLRISEAKLKIHNTEFPEDKFFKNVEWSTQNKAYEFEDMGSQLTNKDLIYQLKTLKDSYRELKVYFLGVHDFFSAMLFATNELRIEKRIKTIETWKISFKSFRNNFGDWFVLWSNLHFSNYGLSWIKPMVWWVLIFTTIASFIIISNFDVGIVPTDRWSYDTDATYYGLKLFLRLLSPVHDSNIVVYNPDPTAPPKTIDIWGVCDFFIRIFASYFIFLIIRGTRKFNFKVG